MRLVALLQARNEARYLPGWLENVAPAVDGIIAIDDGSEDETAALLGGHPKVLELMSKPCGSAWNERGNQMALIKAARARGAEWVLAIDADERLEQCFATEAPRLIAEADTKGIEAYSLQVRELWDSRSQYRVDGIWEARRATACSATAPSTPSSILAHCTATGCRWRLSAGSPRWAPTLT